MMRASSRVEVRKAEAMGPRYKRGTSSRPFEGTGRDDKDDVQSINML